MPDRDSEALALVESMYRVVAGDGYGQLLERYDEFFAEDFEWFPALIGSLDGRSYRGREGFGEYWAEFAAAFAEIEPAEATFEVIGPGRVLATANLHLRGAGGGVPIDREVGYVFEIRDGRIVTGRTFFSPQEAREFLANA